MLRAFNVNLTNVSNAKLRIDDIFIRVPEGSEFAFDWPQMISASSPNSTWKITRRYSVESHACSRFPIRLRDRTSAGFCHHRFSTTASYNCCQPDNTRLEREGYLVQDIKRRIQILDGGSCEGRIEARPVGPALGPLCDGPPISNAGKQAGKRHRAAGRVQSRNDRSSQALGPRRVLRE